MNAEKKWLVKSSDFILGPFEFDRVVENIFSGDIHLLDEIKGPFERWRPIKDHSLFAAAIEKLKASTYEQRDTQTYPIDGGTQTDLTHSETLSVTDALTPSKTPPADQMVTDQTVIYHPVQQPQAPQQTGPFPQQPPTPPQQQRIMQQPPKRRFPVVFLASFLLLMAGGASYLVYEFKQTRLIEQKISAYAQLTDTAIGHLKTGEYQKALKNFNLAYSISPKDPNLLIEMSPLSVQFAGQFDQVRTNLENMLATNQQKTIKKLARNIIGLSYSYRSQFGEALASYNESLVLDDQFFPALLNKSFALIKMKKFDDAVKLMKKVVANNPGEAIAHFFYIRALLEKGIESSDPAALNEAISVSDQFPQKFKDFKQEVLFLRAVAQMNLGKSPEELTSFVKNFLRVDIELTNLHVHDTHIDFQAFNWIDFTGHCDKLVGKLNEYDGKMLKGFCNLKVGNGIEAKGAFEDLLSQQSNDGILQALYASSLLKLNDLSQAKNALGFINQVDQKQPMVETILRGCLVQGDLSCGQAIFKGRHAKNVSLLYSHWGVSEVEFEQNRNKAKTSVMRGLEISPKFAPLLKMKKKFR